MILMPQLNSISAWRGLDTPVDFNLCKELGVEVYEVGAPGGIIVTSPNDFSIEILIPENIDINDQCFLEKFKTYYDKYFDNVEINNNDILINGKKIQGSGSVRANGMYLFMTQVSFEDHFDIINQICQKKSSKQPGIIDSTILSKQMLQEEVLSWL